MTWVALLVAQGAGTMILATTPHGAMVDNTESHQVRGRTNYRNQAAWRAGIATDLSSLGLDRTALICRAEALYPRASQRGPRH